MPILTPQPPNIPTTIQPGDWTGSLNGLSFGPGTPYNLLDIKGWKTMKADPLGGIMTGAASSALPAPKGFTSGAWPVPYWMGKREVSVIFEVTATSTVSFAQAVANLEAATVPSGENFGGTFAFQLDGVASMVSGVSINRDPATDFAYQFGHATVPITFEAFDPRRLASDTLANIASLTRLTNLPTSTGGLVFPLTYPITFSATQVTGSITLTNAGNVIGPLTLTIYGPVTGPMITHQQSGLTLTFSPSFTVNAGDTLVIDCENQTALYNGQASRNAYITSRGWPIFQPGVNTYSFNAAAYNSSAQLGVTATSAWI